ncbi:MAG: hypothetical protein WKG07_33780, partial [Hymenobacter sp.]
MLPRPAAGAGRWLGGYIGVDTFAQQMAWLHAKATKPFTTPTGMRPTDAAATPQGCRAHVRRRVPLLTM